MYKSNIENFRFSERTDVVVNIGLTNMNRLSETLAIPEVVYVRYGDENFIIHPNYPIIYCLSKLSNYYLSEVCQKIGACLNWPLHTTNFSSNFI